MNREEIKSAKYMIENSDISKSLNYDLRNNLIVVKGNELKLKLSEFLLNLILEKNNLFRQLEELSNKIGTPPECKLDEYETKGFRNRLQTIPYKYEWSTIYSEQQSQSSDLLPLVKSEKSDMMCKYNDMARNYVDLSVDSILVKTIYDNVDEKKIYPLKVEFASKIGL